MKEYEARATGHSLLPGLPVAVRIDGRAFHTFTMGCDKPFDLVLSESFRHATQVLVKESGAIIGYTQSDEISLILYQPDYKSQLFFDGKEYKLTSVLASIATAAFNQMWLMKTARRPGAQGLQDVKMATFDCRVWEVPNKMEAVNTLLWREKDARRNSVSSAAQSVYSDRELHGKSSKEQQEMLLQKGINWEDYPKWAKTGTFYRRQTVERELTGEELARIPEKHQPAPGTKVLRTEIVEWHYELAKVANKVASIFSQDPTILLSETNNAAPAADQ